MGFKNNSYFVKNALSLITGGIIAQLIPYIGMFILARLYLPEDFGDFALFTSFSTILAVAAAGRYEFAIQLPKTYIDAISILHLALIIQFCFSIIVLLIILIFQKMDFLSLGANHFWFCLPFSIISITSFQIFIQWLFRYGAYRQINLARLIQAFSTSILSFIFYYYIPKYGLIISFVLGWLLGAISLMFFSFKYAEYNNKLCFFNIKNVAVQYRAHICYGAVPAILDATTIFVLIFIIEQNYGKFYTGEYTMSLKIAYTPISLVVSVIGQLLFKESSFLIQNNKSDSQLFKKAFNILFFVAVLYIGLILFSSSIFFEKILGENWIVAGSITKILAIPYGIKLIVSTLSLFLLSHNKIKINSFWQVIYFFSVVGLNFYKPQNPLDFFKALVYIDVVLYGLYFLLIYNYMNLRNPKNTSECQFD